MDTATTTTATELKTAATRLRCDHAFPCNPPSGSIIAPGPCEHCGIPFNASAAVADHLREPLAKLLDDIADDMSDDGAHERKLVGPAPRRSHLVHNEWGTARFDWTYALDVARVINGGAR